MWNRTIYTMELLNKRKGCPNKKFSLIKTTTKVNELRMINQVNNKAFR